MLARLLGNVFSSCNWRNDLVYGRKVIPFRIKSSALKLTRDSGSGFLPIDYVSDMYGNVRDPKYASKIPPGQCGAVPPALDG
jgi:hypothetical protein